VNVAELFSEVRLYESNAHRAMYSRNHAVLIASQLRHVTFCYNGASLYASLLEDYHGLTLIENHERSFS